MIRILMADDHPVVRKGLKQILLETGEFDVEDVASIPEVREALQRSTPQVLLLDINMPGGSGLEFIQEVRQLHPKLPVLILSVYPEEQVGVRALAAGANGYLNKESAPELIVEAVKKLRAGGRFITPGLAERMADWIQAPKESLDPHLQLSGRENTVFLMIALGKSNGEIATDLNLSPKTVSTYRTRIFEKMGMSSAAELARYAVERNLLH